MLDKASVVGKVNDLEQSMIKVMPVQALANASSTRIAGEAELWQAEPRPRLRRAGTRTNRLPMRSRPVLALFGRDGRKSIRRRW